MDFLKVTIIILFVILTILTVKIHPEIHQTMLIEDADFKLVRISDTLATENIPTSSVVQPSNHIEQKNITVQQPAKTVEIKVSEPVKQQTKEIKLPEQKKSTPEQTQLELLEEIIKLAEQQEKPKQEIQQPVSKPQPSKVQPKSESTHKNPYMTEQEEIIAWNKWRSNIQNEVMKHSGIENAPLGTVFIFNFVVDKFGNVSNIKVICSNPNYMDLARNNMKPAIANLQRKPILNFPRGTQRTSTVVTGSIILGTYERYSTPADYSDYERVVY